MQDNICVNCAWFQARQEPNSDKIEDGECWRFPPVVLSRVEEDGASSLISARAITPVDHYCGEWTSDE